MPTRVVAQSGATAVVANMDDVRSEVQPSYSVVPLMDNPPTVSLSKGSGTNPKSISRLNFDAFEYLGYSPKDVQSGYYGNGVQNGTQMVIDFYSDAPSIEIKIGGGNYNGDLYVDGKRVSLSSIKTDASGAMFIYSVTWESSTVRRYSLKGVNTLFAGVLIGNEYSVWKPTGRRPLLAYQMGDSYTFGTGSSQQSFNGFRIMCDILGFDGLADGIGGAGWTSIQDGRVPIQRVNMKLGNINRPPDVIIFSMGYNDATTGRVEDVKDNMRAVFARARELFSEAIIINIGPATPLGSTDKLLEIRQAEMDACKYSGVPFIDVNDWVNSSNKSIYTGSDDVHPNDAGYAYLGVRIAQEVSSIA